LSSVKEKKSERHRLKTIENHLRHYHQYKIGIRNLKLQLDNIMPRITATYEVKEGSRGTFAIKSDTETYAIDRIESKRALDLHEQMEKYRLLVDCIDAAMEGLNDEEKKFVEYRYFCNYTISKMAMTMGYGESTIFCFRNRVLDKLSHSLSGLVTM